MDQNENMENLSEERLEAMDLTEQAHMLMNSDRVEEALAALEQAEKADPMYIRLYMERGNILVLADRMEEAGQAYEKALMIDKNDAELHYLLGNYHLLKDEYDEAIDAYHEAQVGGYENAYLCNNLGFSYEQAGRLDDSLVAYLRAMRMAPDWAEPFMHQVSVLLRMGEIEQADANCRLLLERFPGESNCYNLMIDILVEQDNFDEAEQVVTIAQQLFPNDKNLLIQQVRVNSLNGKYDQAHEVIARLRAEAQSDDDLDAADMLDARLYLMNEQIDEGVRCYQTAISREKDGQVNIEGRSALMTLFSNLHRFEDLLALANDSLKTSEADGGLCIAYAMQPFALENLGRMEEAIPLYQQNLRKLRLIGIKDRTRADTHIYRVICLRGLKQYDKALDELKYCESVLPEPNDMLERLKQQILLEKGDVKAAGDIEAKLHAKYAEKPTDQPEQ